MPSGDGVHNEPERLRQPKGRRTGLHQPSVLREKAPRLILAPEVIARFVAALDGGDIVDKGDLHKFKLSLAREYKLPKVPSDADLLFALPDDAAARHRTLLRMKATRTLSGVAIVTVQASPEHCPHGTCTFCPGGPDVGSAQSYTGEEPAALRARQHAFDPYAQTASRLASLKETGHDIDKVDLIIQGGTFPARDPAYQTWFVQRCLDAMNDADLGWDPDVGPRPESVDIETAKAINETAPARCIGLTVETKPDWWRIPHIDRALEYAATRVEIGVQTVFDDVLRATNRGHTILDTVESTREAKDAGYKIVYHLMPGLPGSTPERDLESARAVFEDPAFRPDMIKIYPTLVMPGTPLAVMHSRGDYVALPTDAAAEIVAEVKRLLPPYVRVQRVDRDIPTTLVAAGVDKSNLRQIAQKVLAERHGEVCKCVRCREVGHLRRAKDAHATIDADAFDARDLVLTDYRYAASGGEERFLALEDRDDGALFGYLRLRHVHDPHRPELRDGDAMIREVKVPGTVVPVGADDETKAQHRGVGARLVAEAARIAVEEWETSRLFVIAGVGVKPYYRRLGFKDDGVYLRADVSMEGPHHGLAITTSVADVPRAWPQAWDLDRSPRPASARQTDPVPKDAL